mgnify:CR=1 FL=1
MSDVKAKDKEYKIFITLTEDEEHFYTLADLRKDRGDEIADTWYWEEHPENYDKDCYCDECMMYDCS